MILQDKPKPLAPAGVHTAILYQVVDLGTQKTDYQGDVKISHKVRFTWELCDELMEDGRPFVVSKRYTLSAHEKAILAIDIKSWTGVAPNGINIETLLGKACNVNVVHEQGKDGLYARVASLAPLKKGEKQPKQYNANLMFDLEDFNAAAFEALPEFIREQIKLSPEYAEIMSGGNKQSGPPAGHPASAPTTAPTVSAPTTAPTVNSEDLTDEIPF